MRDIQLFGGRLLVEVDDFVKETASGIAIPDVWKDGHKLEGARNTGVVLNIGQGMDSTMQSETVNHVKVGQRIKWTSHTASYTFDEDGKTYAIIKFEHVQCILHDA